ncbi:MAG: helix-turn-helix domain-containing protein, partial [Pseudomonadota bacterium]
YHWPGNLRELHNVLERTLLQLPVQQDSVMIEDKSILAAIRGSDFQKTASFLDMGNFPHVNLREAREIFEREYLTFHMDRFHGNVSRTASFVGMDRAALHRKMRALESSSRLGDETP